MLMMFYVVPPVAAMMVGEPAPERDNGNEPPQAPRQTDAGAQELRERLDALQAKIAAHRHRTYGEWLTEQRAREIRALVQDVLADADTRSSSLDDGLTAGWDNGFFISDSEGAFSMKAGGVVQVRYVFSHQSEDAMDDTSRGSFENRRTKFGVEGHIFDPAWMYRASASFSRDGGAFLLEDAYVGRNFGGGWVAHVGQFKLPFLREDLVSDNQLLTVERTLVNDEFKQDRAQAIQIGHTGERLTVRGAFSDGFISLNKPALIEDVEYAFTARAETLIDGSWSQFGDFSSWRGEDFGLMVGGAAHYQVDEYGTAEGPQERIFSWTADASAEFGGSNLFAAIVGRHLREAELDQYGFVIQGGFFVSNNCELFARYEWGDLETAGVDDLSIVTAGVTRFWAKHRLRWTTDVGYGLDPVSSAFASTGAGWRVDPAEADGQVVLRTQWQIVY